MSHVKVCQSCAVEFTSRRSDARYCNSSCRADASRARKNPVRPVGVYTHCRCGQLVRIFGMDSSYAALPVGCPACGAPPSLNALIEATKASLRAHRSIVRYA